MKITLEIPEGFNSLTPEEKQANIDLFNKNIKVALQNGIYADYCFITNETVKEMNEEDEE